MIRDYRHEDVKNVMVLLEQLRRDGEYRMMVPCWPEIVNTIVGKSEKKGGRIWLSEHDGEITGLLMATAQPLWWVDQRQGPRIATDLLFTSKRYGDGKALLHTFVEWAFSQPRVVRIEMAISGSKVPLKTMERLYASEGFELEGSFYVKNHPEYQARLDQTKEGMTCPD